MNAYDLKHIPMTAIFADPTFNVRGMINPADCNDLAKDIYLRGLDMPISVWQHCDPAKPHIQYKILAGHRRYSAFKINGEATIPCYIRTDITSDYEALAYNLRENILRKDLTLAQEAKRVGQMIGMGKSIEQVGESLGKTSAWITPRKQLMELPIQVFEAAEKRIVNQGHIQVLYEARKNPEKLFNILREIKERYESGEKGIRIKEELTVSDIMRVRRPKPMELEELRSFMASSMTCQLGNPYFLPHQLLSWMLGDLSIVQIYRACIAVCEDEGIEYTLPFEIDTLMQHVPSESELA